MEKVLEVKNLTISFKTQSGKLQAVRNISFDLNRGETLAIVGESGSGKSVTSKAIIGILAGNSIVENGEILYDGQDLLKIDEEDFHKLRGNKISMIFQDPLSSLNPIVKIGKQLTEAMILKGKANQRESRKTFNNYLKNLTNAMVEAEASGDAGKEKEIRELSSKFNKFEYRHLALEGAYNKAFDAAKNGSVEIKELLFEIDKKAFENVARRSQAVVRYARESINDYVVKEDKEKVLALASSINGEYKSSIKSKNYDALNKDLADLKEIFDKVITYTKPNFFAMGYYMTFVSKELPSFSSIEDLNVQLRQVLDDKFMLNFIANAKQGLISWNEKFNATKLTAIEVLKEQKKVFEKEEIDYKECLAAEKLAYAAVKASINPLELRKDSPSYTFHSAMLSKIRMYFIGAKKNGSEQRKYDRQNAKIERIIAKGKTPEWKPVPPSIVNLPVTKAAMNDIFAELIVHLNDLVEANKTINFDDRTVDVIDYLKANASGVVNRITQQDAKNTAIRLMEEVGIKEAQKRYDQYPFEFSGGMRQRIVIAIALASNPDILICDEPTTALDVTIQGQILELINRLKKERNLSIIFITHDLGVVANMADRVAVMYAGKIVEYGSVENIFYNPKHPYTWALLSSIPDLDTNEKLDSIPGTPPNMIYPPVGDAFAARNKYAMRIDFEKQPPMFKVEGDEDHYAATWLLHPDALKIYPPHIVTERIERMKRQQKEDEANE